MPPRIAVIGSTNVDFIMKLRRLPARGQTETDGEFLQTFGGKGANQAVAAARAGGAVSFVTAVGRDPLGDRALANFQADGIDVSAALRADAPTGAALVMFDAAGDNYLSVAPGANYAIGEAHLLAHESAIADAAMVVLQMEIPPETVDAALRLAGRHGVPAMLNYAPPRGVPVAVDHRINVLVVNEHEASILLGGRSVTADTAARAAADLRALGPATVVVTLGAAGAVADAGDGPIAVAASAVDVVDTTAAGDTFCGVLAVRLARGDALPDALRIGNDAAGRCCAAMGAQPSIPRLRDDGGLA